MDNTRRIKSAGYDEEQEFFRDECGQGDYYHYQYKNENNYYHIKEWNS